MKSNLSQIQQKQYFAVFQSKNIMDLSCENRLKLFQFADVHCKTDNDYNNIHRQWCDEITFVYSGEGEIVSGNNRYTVKSGQVHLCFTDEMHQIIPSKTSPLRFFCIGFILDRQNPLYPLFQAAKEEIIRSSNAMLSGRTDLLQSFQLALSAIYSEDNIETNKAIITNTVNFILSSVFSDFLNVKSENTKTNISMKGSLVFYIVSYLKNNVYNINALSSLAEDTGYSYSYISHLFSKRMGQSLKDFFARLRMDAATELLESKSVTEVSDLLGYSSVHAFTRAYKAVHSAPPSQVKKGK